MNNKIKQEIDKIEIPIELHDRSKMGVSKAKLEMGGSKRKWYYILAPVFVALLALAIVSPNLFSNEPPENPTIRTIEFSNAFDVSDARKLVGWSNNVFIGKVIDQVGNVSSGGVPETQFKVEVSENIKGNLNGTVIVNQQGGYDGDELILVEKDQLLQKGKSFLFITRKMEEKDWHSLVPVYGDIEITNEDFKREQVEKYKKAYEEEIPFELKHE
ncbi:hypothetical protein [Bacillus sp. FJAT-29814]|uniref:hypothetical protein n=1 Tax=Bacillus sp. FJAT-29814 TaxID=1729688 RepID=UPI00082CB856|nr:hypothetical protein [Bacillus sp. FJAT-29814]